MLCSDRTLQSYSKLRDSGHTGSGQASLLKKATKGRQWDRTQTAFQDFLFYFHFLFKIQHPIFCYFLSLLKKKGELIKKENWKMRMPTFPTPPPFSDCSRCTHLSLCRKTQVFRHHYQRLLTKLPGRFFFPFDINSESISTKQLKQLMFSFCLWGISFSKKEVKIENKWCCHLWSEGHIFSKMGQRRKVQVAGPGKRSVYSQDAYKLMIMTAALSRGNNVIRLW